MSIWDVIRSFGRRDDSPFPRWPSLPKIGNARAGYESVLLATFTCLGHVLREKSVSTRDVLKDLKKFATSELRVSAADEILAINIFTQAHHGKGNFSLSIQRFAEYSAGSELLRRRFLETLVYFAGLRRSPSQEVDQMLLYAGDILEAPDVVAELKSRHDTVKSEAAVAERDAAHAAQESVKRLRLKVKQVTAKTLDRSYLVLGCAETDPITKIEAEYKRLVFVNHPDRARGRGESPERVEEFRQKYEQILAAFATISAKRKPT